MTRLRWCLAIAVVVVLGIGVGFGLPTARRNADRAADEERIRALIDQYPVFPGVELVEDRVFEIPGDSGGTGEYTVELAYRVPEDVRAAEVIAFFRSAMPEGWTEASDEICRSYEPSLVLLQRESRLTVFAPEGGGLSFQATRSMVGEKQIVVTPDGFSCGGPEVDQHAQRFDADAPAGPQVIPTVPVPQCGPGEGLDTVCRADPGGA